MLDRVPYERNLTLLGNSSLAFLRRPIAILSRGGIRSRRLRLQVRIGDLLLPCVSVPSILQVVHRGEHLDFVNFRFGIGLYRQVRVLLGAGGGLSIVSGSRVSILVARSLLLLLRIGPRSRVRRLVDHLLKELILLLLGPPHLPLDRAQHRRSRALTADVRSEAPVGGDGLLLWRLLGHLLSARLSFHSFGLLYCVFRVYSFENTLIEPRRLNLGALRSLYFSILG